MQPGDVVAQRVDLPARHRVRRDEHGQVRLAAGGRKGAGDVMRLARGALEADDEHVFRHPPLVTGLPARDAQRVAFLAEQRIAAVARTDALDVELVGKMHDETALGIEVAGRVQPANEAAFAFDALQRGVAHACHEFHVDDDIRAVRNLDAAARVRGIDRPHAVGDDIHRAALHRAVEKCVDLRMALGWAHPVVVRTGVVALRGADIGQVFHPGHIGGIRQVQVAVRVGVGVERGQGARIDHLLDELSVLRVGAGAPVDVRGSCSCGDLIHPLLEGR